LANRFDSGVRFQFDIEHVDTLGVTVPANMILSWYSASAADSAFVPEISYLVSM